MLLVTPLLSLLLLCYNNNIDLNKFFMIITITSGLESHSIITCNELEKSLITEKVNLAFVNHYFLVIICRYNEIT